jgi:hypothetical protein
MVARGGDEGNVRWYRRETKLILECRDRSYQSHYPLSIVSSDVVRRLFLGMITILPTDIGMINLRDWCSVTDGNKNEGSQTYSSYKFHF